MKHLESELTKIARSVVEPMGYELLGVEYLQRGHGGAVLRAYIDRREGDPQQGITLDDCSVVSHQLSGVLDVEDPLHGHYDLEVSSPGLDRPLFSAAHFERFRGHKARIRLADKLEGRRNFSGEIAGTRGGEVLLTIDGETLGLPLAMIQSAHLVPEFRCA